MDRVKERDKLISMPCRLSQYSTQIHLLIVHFLRNYITINQVIMLGY